jgi:hypothetical protein
MRGSKLNIYILCLVAFFSCTERKMYNNSLTIKFENNNSSKAYLYSFIGNKQIFQDSIIIHNNKLSYSFNSGLSEGIYRVYYEDSKSIDIIYNYEDIDVLLVNKDDFPNVVVKKSEENKIFYKYLNSYNNFNKFFNEKITEVKKNDNKFFLDSINELIEHEYKKLSKILVKENKDYLAHLYISVIYRPQKEFVRNINSSEEIEKFMLNNYLNSIPFNDDRILASPYLYYVLNNYIEYFFDKDSYADAYKKISKLSSENNLIHNFSTQLIFENLIKHNNFEKLSTTFLALNPNDCPFNNNNNSQIKFDESINKVFKNDTIRNKCLLFISSDCKTSSKVIEQIASIPKTLFSVKIINEFGYVSDSLFINDSISINHPIIPGSPSLFLFDENLNHVASWFGSNLILSNINMIEQQILY